MAFSRLSAELRRPCFAWCGRERCIGDLKSNNGFTCHIYTSWGRYFSSEYHFPLKKGSENDDSTKDSEGTEERQRNLPF